jgi:hypothetical protein
MKKIVFLGITLTLLTTLLGFAFQGKSKDVPPEVDPTMWVPVAENFGIVLEGRSSRAITGLIMTDELNLRGTLMVKVGGSWHPLYLIPHVNLEPAQSGH